MPKKSKTGKGRLDKYYHLAKDQGYRARSAFKLIQLAKKQDFLSKAKICIDLCAAPGGWSQVAQRNMPTGSLIIAVDLVSIKPIHGVTCMQTDITTEKCRQMLRKEMKGDKADVVLHDGAPNVGANWAKDAFGQNELTLSATKTACEHLRPGGTFVTKVFRSSDYNSLLWVFNQLFGKVDATKPTASRNVSAEIFVVCTGFKAPKIDPKFFNPKFVFMETVDPIEEKRLSGDSGKRPGASIADYIKFSGKKHRSGYEWGDNHRVVSANEFLISKSPADVLISNNRIDLEAPDCEDLATHKLTTDEIKILCADLKVLGKKDLTLLLKWRMLVLRGRERAGKKAQKEATGSATMEAGDAGVGGARAAAAADPERAMDQDVDDAISAFLNEGVAPTAKASADTVEADEELERDLAEQVAKKRADEKREAKKIITRQKKQDWRRTMSLTGSSIKNSASQDQPELFRVTDRSVQALEDEDEYIDPAKHGKESGEEDSDEVGAAGDESDDSSDEELDRLARMEVDLAVDHHLRKLRSNDTFRTAGQRVYRKKKESRRQRVMQMWSGELTAFNEEIDKQASAAMSLQNKEAEDSDGDDSDVDDNDIKALRDFQRQMREADAAGKDDGRGEALAALAAGGNPGERRARATEEASEDGEEDGDEDEGEESEDADDADGAARAALPAPTSASTALVPLSGDALKAEHRANRWFSQDIFGSVGADEEVTERRVAKKKKTGFTKDGSIMPLDRDSSASESGDEEVAMNEFADRDLPKLPLTDKEKRSLKRKKDKERNELRGKHGKTSKADEEDAEDLRPMEVAPLEAPRSIVPQGPQKPSDPRELAETMALGSLMVESKKSRMQLIDAAYNRWSFDGDEGLPDWFTEEEEKYNKPELPISKDLMNQFRQKLREINARPIRKVAEARARKGRRLKKRLDKIRSSAMVLAENGEMNEHSKARQMRKMVSKMARSDQRGVSVVAIAKGGGGRKADKGKAPKGAKVKVVDKRAKSDRRGEKRAMKHNKEAFKLRAKKQSIKKQKGRGGINNKRISSGGGGKKKGAVSGGFSGDTA